MTAFRMAQDADCDIAALVYGADQGPDRLLAAFAADLRTRGVNAVGVLQRRGGEGAADGLVFVPGGATLAIPRCGTRDHDASAAWSGALVHAEAWLLKAARQKPDLLVLNRYGAAERSGGGLLRVIAEAVSRDVPVLLPVPQARFADWLRFSEGLFVKLDCTRGSLEAWWAGVTRPAGASPRPSYCERVK